MKRGFTIIEISIVLVIVGLVIGGILVARSIVSSSKLTGLIHEIGKYDAVTRNFYISYQALPGDSRDVEPAGDGNGSINTWSHMYQSLADSYWHESFNFWRQLKTAHEIKETYIAYSGPANFPGDFEGLVPKLNYGTNCYLNAYTVPNTDVHAGASTFRNIWAVSGGTPQGIGSCMTSNEALALDAKMDDGKRDSGNVQLMASYSGPTINGNSGECVANASGNPYDIEGRWINAFWNQPEPNPPYDRVGCMFAIKANWN